MEHLLIAIWRAPGADPSTLRADWAPLALKYDNVLACSMSFAEADQGAFADGDPVDVLIALGLDRGHDLDDVPERGVLYHVARELEVWRVDRHRQISVERTTPDGEFVPGVKMVSFVRRAEHLSHEQFVRHWTERHTPLVRTHHVGVVNYTQNVVRRAYTPGGAAVDGIAELDFVSRESYETEFYDSDEGRTIIKEDVQRFIARPPIRQAALMRELPLKTPEA